MGNLFAPASADIDLIAIHALIIAMEGTFADTATAVVAKLCINFQLAVCVFLRRMDGTSLLQLTFLTERQSSI